MPQRQSLTADVVEEAHRGLAVDICGRLDEHLATEQRLRSAVDLLASGAAFEAWLAFEARLLAEGARNELGLAELTKDPHGAPVPRYWMANEYCKIDFYIGDVRDNAAVLALEFKLIHNNKNWKHKSDEVWADLFPMRGTKVEIAPRLGRLAVVGVIGKVYRDPTRYPGQVEALAEWEREVEAHLLPEPGREGRRAVRTWSGQRFELSDPWLEVGHRHSFQLHLLVPVPAPV